MLCVMLDHCALEDIGRSSPEKVSQKLYISDMPQNILASRTSNWIHIVSLAQSNISQAPEGWVGPSPMANYPNPSPSEGPAV